MTEPLRSTLRSKLPALIGATVATVLVTVFSSFLGVRGTLVGLALSTALTGVLSTVSEHTVHQAYERARLRWHGYHVQDPYAGMYRASHPRNVPYKLIAASMGVIGLASFATVLVIEAAAGKPVSNVVQGTHGSGFSVAHSSTPAPPVRRPVTHEHQTHPPRVTFTTVPATNTPLSTPTPAASTPAVLPDPASTPSTGTLSPSPSPDASPAGSSTLG